MKVYVVVGENKQFNNISARAVYVSRQEAEKFDPWFDDRWQIVELELAMPEVKPFEGPVAESILKQLGQ